VDFASSFRVSQTELLSVVKFLRDDFTVAQNCELAGQSPPLNTTQESIAIFE
jgi:hypothetical protein